MTSVQPEKCQHCKVDSKRCGLRLQDCSKQLPIAEAELELILQRNENLPTDEMELIIRDLIVMGIRERDYIKDGSQTKLNPSFDMIDDLERHLKFYKTRMNYLQCWQSSMRDPERKIVCDILANGFTLVTKEEIDNANASVRDQTLDELKPIIRELRNALIVSANNAHARKKLVNECNPYRMFYNEMQYQSLVESALACSSDFKGEYESDTALDWYRESLIKQEHSK